MNPKMVAVQAGLRRGVIEIRQTLTNGPELSNYLFFPAIILIVMFFLRRVSVPGSNFSLSSATMPSVLGMQIAFGGLIGIAIALITEREDGTLLRAKAVPNGMLGYLIGKVLQFSGMSLIALAIILIPSAFLFDGLQLRSPNAWL